MHLIFFYLNMSGPILALLNTRDGENHLDSFLCPSETSREIHTLLKYLPVKLLPQRTFLRFAFTGITICTSSTLWPLFSTMGVFEMCASALL